ncbi:hypothetical protein AMATHDRAFT_136828 [Amanita thiersii Skay4041]|uniref:Uncharacterized protein n=1 Tax=Amanita thiersii Skay4041 TaxID=703135 RepID=A0A2A9NZX8_9AGAR|nr:hypothetical protein AMATHDRAFT_136828 [Amanita thiersii Skay4041]
MVVKRFSLRSVSTRIIFLGTSLSFLLFFYAYSSVSDGYNISFKDDNNYSCSPLAYSAGKWAFHPKSNASTFTSRDDALKFSGFDSCASSREFFWHLAADNQDQWSRFPAAHNWEWVPSRQCQGLRPFNAEQVVKDLVEQGGWFLVGDSVTENHFFSLSCLLYPHVLGSPNYTASPNFDRAWPQFLHLNPKSPLISRIAFPPGFDINTTPLVAFRRIDLLYSQQELIDIHRAAYPSTPKDFKLFSDEPVWTLPPSDYLANFTAPLPHGNYRTMVVSTAGHWTTTLFSGFRDEKKASKGYGIDRVLKLFNIAMKKWSDEVQSALRRNEISGAGKRRVLIRAYLPGHEDCHSHREPWTKIKSYSQNWYNWNNIKEFNNIFERVLSARIKYPDIIYLPIDRPARLRPDAHTTSDCLHIMTGAGVLEGWSHYIWHFVTRELVG